MTARNPTEHDICPPVGDVFGDDSELASELMTEPSASAEAAAIADTLRWEHASSASDSARSYESGASARLAIIRQACSSCALADCLVRDNLQAAADRRLPHQGIETSPPYSFALDTNVIRTERDATPAKQLAELRGMQVLDEQAELPTFVLHRASGKPLSIEVIDATSVIANGNIGPANPAELAILQRKLATSATERNDSGQPQAFSPDGQMIRRIYTQPNSGAQLYEVRMNGKSRLYFMPCPPNTTRPHNRIILIGSHGDSSQHQRRFIAAVIKNSARPIYKFANS